MQNSTAAIGKLQVTARRDLRYQVATNRENRVCYHVLDPLTRQSYRIGELERAILDALNAHRALPRALKELRRDPQFTAITDRYFAEVIQRLQRIGLVRVADDRSDSAHAASKHAARIQSTLASFVSWQLRVCTLISGLPKQCLHGRSVLGRGGSVLDVAFTSDLLRGFA